MTNKKVLQKKGVNKNKPGITPIDKKDTLNIMSEKVEEKKSSALVAASRGRSAIDAADAHSSKDVRGSSGLANTGTIISYD